MTTDVQLLRSYICEHSEQAFGELVSRHIDLVYSAALRVVGGDTHLAQDVAQMVFTDLARKARALSPGVVLPGWLHRHACFTASKAVRTERRRQTREQVAMEMTTLHDQTEAKWERIAPHLDEALNRLSSADRDAVVLRFLKQQDLRTVGVALGVSEDGAQKRVSRALEKLRVLLEKRGATLSTAALATVLTAEAVTAAPAGLATSVAAASLASAAAAATGLGATFTNLMALTKVKAAVFSALLIAGMATPLVVQRRQLEAARREGLALRQQVQDLARLREEAPRPADVQVRAEESERQRQEHADLLRLRGQVASLRSLNEDLLKNQTAKESSRRGPRLGPSAFIPTENLADAGLATPEAAAQTFAFAMVKEDKERFKETLDLEKFNQAIHEARHKVDPDFKPEDSHEDDFSIHSFDWKSRAKGIQILSQQFNSSEEVEVELACTSADNSAETNRLTFHRVGDEWKVDLLAMMNPDASLYLTNTVTSADGTEKPEKIVKLKVEEIKAHKLVPDPDPP